MPLPNLSDLTPEQKAQVEEAHEAFLLAEAFTSAILTLEHTEQCAYAHERWEQHVIPVLRAEHEKAYAERLRIVRELGYEGS